MPIQVCPLHAFEDSDGEWVSSDVGWQFTCPRSDHVTPGPYTWLSAPPPPSTQGLSGIADELGLDIEIPLVLGQFNGAWVEYGVFEHAYAVSHPKEWAELIDRYGHTAIAEKRYTASAFLASTLGHLSRAAVVLFHAGPATGRWDYNRTISWWALPPEPDWNNRLSWQDSGLSVKTYVPGYAESARD